jgi:hypothetical protein
MHAGFMGCLQPATAARNAILRSQISASSASRKKNTRAELGGLRGVEQFVARGMAGADLVKRNLRKLPRVAAPLEIRKLALYDLANALANVDGPHERAVVEACATGEIVGQLAALLIDTDAAQGLEEVRATNQAKGNFTLVSSSCTIRVGQRELRMDGVESRLYVLTCLVNLIYIGGGHLLYERGGAGLNILADALMEPPLAAGAAKDEAMEQRRAQMEPLLYYAVAGLFNLSDSAAFAKAVSAKPGLQQRLQQLTSSSHASTAKAASLAAAHAAARRSRGPPACSGLPAGPEGSALAQRSPPVYLVHASVPKVVVAFGPLGTPRWPSTRRAPSSVGRRTPRRRKMRKS